MGNFVISIYATPGIGCWGAINSIDVLTFCLSKFPFFDHVLLPFGLAIGKVDLVVSTFFRTLCMLL